MLTKKEQQDYWQEKNDYKEYKNQNPDVYVKKYNKQTNKFEYIRLDLYINTIDYNLDSITSKTRDNALQKLSDNYVLAIKKYINTSNLTNITNVQKDKKQQEQTQEKIKEYLEQERKEAKNNNE